MWLEQPVFWMSKTALAVDYLQIRVRSKLKRPIGTIAASRPAHGGTRACWCESGEIQKSGSEARVAGALKLQGLIRRLLSLLSLATEHSDRFERVQLDYRNA